MAVIFSQKGGAEFLLVLLLFLNVNNSVNHSFCDNAEKQRSLCAGGLTWW